MKTWRPPPKFYDERDILGQLQLRGTFFPVWSFTLPDRPVEESRAAGRDIAAALSRSSS